jgi:hypothetical protein
MWVKDAEEHGYDQPLRDYMNGCVLAARHGTILISPFISKQEQAVMSVLLKENLLSYTEIGLLIKHIKSVKF